MHREQGTPAATRPHSRGTANSPLRPARRAGWKELFRVHWLLLPILAALPACDNVEWGGAEIEFIPPPPSTVLATGDTTEEGRVESGLPAGPVLFHLRKGDAGWVLNPVAEISGDSLRTLTPPEGAEGFADRFRETVLPVGSQFRVFRRGAPVGTFTVERPGAANPCGLPTGLGNATVVAAAADADEFLAVREGLAPEVRGQFNPPQITGSIRTYASIVAERLILQAGLPRPRSWTGAQEDLQAIEIIAGGHPEMAATYLVGDSLGVGPGDPQGYSVFYLGDYETARGYHPVYQRVQDYRRAGKAAPVLIDYLDWNGVPGQDLLLRVYGRNDSWYEALSADPAGKWAKVWEGGGC